MFYRKKYPKLKRKHPDMHPAELITRLQKDYAALSNKKRACYQEKAAVAVELYKEELRKFEREHPEATLLGTLGPPKYPPNAAEIFAQEHEQVPRAEARAAYRALSESEQTEYRARADRLRERYLRTLEEYTKHFPGWRTPGAPLTKLPKVRQEHVRRITPAEAFVRQSMPRELGALTRDEWRRVLFRKFARLGEADKVRAYRLWREYVVCLFSFAFLSSLCVEYQSSLLSLLRRMHQGVSGNFERVDRSFDIRSKHLETKPTFIQIIVTL